MNNDTELTKDEWKKIAAAQQQEFYERFGDRKWNSIELNEDEEKNIMQKMLSEALYGKEYEECDAKALKRVNKTSKKVRELSGSRNPLLLGYTYVIIRKKGDKRSYLIHLIRTKNQYSKDTFFMEPNSGRVYRGWDDYIENNKLPRCIMCFPSNGIYTGFEGRVEIRFKNSPSCSILSNVLDVAGSVVGIGTPLVLLSASFFPPLALVSVPAALIAASASAHTGGRGTNSMVDIDKHQDPNNTVSTWLNKIFSAVGGLTMDTEAIMPNLLSSTRLTTKTISAITDVLSTTSIASNNVGVGFMVVDVILKLAEGKLSLRDVKKFISKCCFIGNIVITRPLAEKLIRMILMQPSRIANCLCMVFNTGYSKIKPILYATQMPFCELLQHISGQIDMFFSKWFGTSFMSSFVEKVFAEISDFMKSGDKLFNLPLYELLHNLIETFTKELNEAYKNLSMLFRRSARQTDPNGNYHSLPASTILDINSEFEKCINNLHIYDEDLKTSCKYALANFIEDVESKIKCSVDFHFGISCKILLPKILKQYRTEKIILESENENITNSNKEGLFVSIIDEFRINPNELKSDSEQESSSSNRRGGSSIFTEPLCLEDESLVYYFNTTNVLWEKHRIEGACELFECNKEDIADIRAFSMTSDDLRLCYSLSIIEHRCSGKWLIYGYCPQITENGTDYQIFGVAILTKKLE